MPNKTNAALNTPVANLAPDGSKVAFVDDDAGDTVRDLDVQGKLLHVIASRLCKPNLQYVVGGGKQLILAAYPKKQRQAFGDGLGRLECRDPRKRCPRAGSTSRCHRPMARASPTPWQFTKRTCRYLRISDCY